MTEHTGGWALLFEGTLHELAGARIVVGRARECDVVLDYPSISRRHAVLSLGPDGPSLEDLGSRHGTTVNDRPLEAATRLAHGDRIGLGGLTAVVRDLTRGGVSGAPTAQIRRARIPKATDERGEITQEIQLEPVPRDGTPRR